MILKVLRACRRACSGPGCVAGVLFALSAQAAQTDIAGPAGSVRFGDVVRVLPNGNIVVVDTRGPVSDIGSVHLYDPNGVLISTLTGGSADDRIGSGGIVVLPSGNFVISSRNWDNPATGAADAGAYTWVNGNTGLSGVVSSANSLVGSSADDSGFNRIVVLSSGNYLVVNPSWDNGIGVDAGAVTWGSGSSGISGVISPTNSLVGSKDGDQVGRKLTVLTNGNYVVCSEGWDRDGMVDAGAATWAKGNTGLTGVVSTGNSLVGSSAQDRVCSSGVVALSNGHYAVASPNWNNGATVAPGAVTWGNGQLGTAGVVSTGNSLVGVNDEDQVGVGVFALTNGNYVVTSPNWDNAAIVDAGAATLLNGNGPVAASVSTANSLVGSTAQDRVGQLSLTPGVVALANGHYVVTSDRWDNGATADVGAVTWGNGVSGAIGTISPANSLVGTSESDRIGFSGVVALTNGNYVVSSPLWNNGAVVDAGAVTWGNGGSGSIGPVSVVNSLVGSSSDDGVGSAGALALSNGNYVARHGRWNDGAVDNVGAVTWGDGASGTTGVVSPANSLVGSSPNDQLGAVGTVALANGNYVIGNPFWDNGAVLDAGAATWGNGSGGTVGAVSAANSLVGSSANDLIGNGLTAFTDGNYATLSGNWDNGGMADAGAATLGLGNQPLTGTVMPANSVIGGVVTSSATIDYDPVRRRLVVGRPGVNIVSLLTVDLPDPLFANGFE